jgi:hypothetical protein
MGVVTARQQLAALQLLVSLCILHSVQCIPVFLSNGQKAQGEMRVQLSAQRLHAVTQQTPSAAVSLSDTGKLPSCSNLSAVAYQTKQWLVCSCFSTTCMLPALQQELL